MYCIQCGIELADTEKKCPLCKTRVYHPELHQQPVTPLYPENRYPEETRVSRGLPIFMTAVFSLALFFVLLCDLQLHGSVTWSGYVVGALAVTYVILVLPGWFKDPNPVIFVPCGFAAVAAYLLQLALTTGGSWFMPFAFPVVGGLCLLTTALVTLLKYVPKGKLFVVGGFCISLGGFMLLVEFLLHLTFVRSGSHGWSAYPMTALILLGGFLIFLGICRPAREAMERKLFF